MEPAGTAVTANATIARLQRPKQAPVALLGNGSVNVT
jgi:hypothetical protein